MPNKPKYPPFNVRVPREVSDEIRDIAREEGLQPGEVLTELVRGAHGRYRAVRKQNGGRPLGRDGLQRRRIDSSVKLRTEAKRAA